MARRRVALPPPYLLRVEVEPDRLRGRSGYPFDLPLVRGLDLQFERAVTVLIGDNGTGKSTLLEAIAELAGFLAAGGARAHVGAVTDEDRRLAEELDRDDVSGSSSARLRSLREDHRLTAVLRAGWLPKVTDGFFFRAETFFTLARYLDARSIGIGGAPEHLRRSHAEGFLDFFGQRLSSTIRGGRPSLYVFDEPESALSPRRQLEFMRWIRRVEDSRRGQVIVATHSPLLMAFPGADLWRIADGRVAPVALRDVEALQILREFVAEPHEYVARALRDE